ncbi:MAG TPA: tryptophan synthase subunit alpha [Saprospiraceae bacterium]|nr:tryptophan synthase subunit alpha [Saprospiraceae bacterium]
MKTISTPRRNRQHVETLFTRNRTKILSIYIPAGYPEIDSLPGILQALEENGVDMVEIGIPFSDPLADGPVIQACHSRALANGMSLDLLFEQLDSVRVRIPLLLMGYYNSVLQFGVDRFCRCCVETGISGVIIPDLPIELYVSAYQDTFRQHNVCCVFMITPQTSDARIRSIDAVSTGFLYAVSSASTTGMLHAKISHPYLQRLSAMGLRNPVMTGFNIHDNTTFRQATEFSRGAIIGSAFLRSIAESTNQSETIRTFINNIKHHDHSA